MEKYYIRGREEEGGSNTVQKFIQMLWGYDGDVLIGDDENVVYYQDNYGNVRTLMYEDRHLLDERGYMEVGLFEAIHLMGKKIEVPATNEKFIEIDPMMMEGTIYSLHYELSQMWNRLYWYMQTKHGDDGEWKLYKTMYSITEISYKGLETNSPYQNLYELMSVYNKIRNHAKQFIH